MHQATHSGFRPKGPGGLEAQIDHPPYRTLDLARADGELARLQGHIAHAMRVGLHIAQGTRDGLVSPRRGQRAQLFHHHLDPVRLVPERMPQPLVQRLALGLGQVTVRGNRLVEILAGVVESSTSTSLAAGISARRVRRSVRSQIHSAPSAINSTTVGMRRPQQPQIADHQGPRRLGIPDEGIIERQTQPLRLPLSSRMSMTSTRGSRHGVENPWRPLAVLRPRWVRRRRTRPPSRLTRTRLPARGPSQGTGTWRAASTPHHAGGCWPKPARY